MSLHQKCSIPNARIFYSTGDATVVSRDPVTDRPIFANTIEQSILCSLEPDETEPAIRNLDGVDQTELRLSGRLIEPETIPIAIDPGGKYRIIYHFSGVIGVDATYREGVVHVFPSIPSKFPRARSRFKDWIQCTLVTVTNNYYDNLEGI